MKLIRCSSKLRLSVQFKGAPSLSDTSSSSCRRACTQFPLFLRSHPVTQSARQIRSIQSIRHPSPSASPMFELWRATVFPTCSEQIVHHSACCCKYARPAEKCRPAVRREVLINSCSWAFFPFPIGKFIEVWWGSTFVAEDRDRHPSAKPRPSETKR